MREAAMGVAYCDDAKNVILSQAERIEELEEVANQSLKIICLTKHYIGSDQLPAVDGWEWYDTGKRLVELVPDCEWAKQFILRTRRDNEREADK